MSCNGFIITITSRNIMALKTKTLLLIGNNIADMKVRLKIVRIKTQPLAITKNRVTP